MQPLYEVLVDYDFDVQDTYGNYTLDEAVEVLRSKARQLEGRFNWIQIRPA